MKITLIAFLSFLSFSVCASDLGKCTIFAISDSSVDDSTPRKTFNIQLASATLSDCIKQFDKTVEYLKGCGHRPGGRIHYTEMQFKIKDRSVMTLEPLNVICI